MIDVNRTGCRRGKRVTVERRVGPRDDRPGRGISGRFASEVTSLKFGEGGVDVVDVEREARDDAVFCVNLEDVEHLDAEFVRPHPMVPGADMSEGEARPAGRKGGRRNLFETHLGGRSHFRYVIIATVLDAGVHDPTTIICENVMGGQFRHRVPVAGREVGPEALVHLSCRVFQSPCLRMQLVELRERGIEVGLVEDFGAVDQVAFDGEDLDHPPFGIETLLRGSFQALRDDGFEFAEPMHGLDVSADIRHEVPCGTDVRVSDRSPRWLPAGDDRCRPNSLSSGGIQAVESRPRTGDHGPRSRMGSCFPGEVPGVEFGEGGIQVVDVEDDASRALIFGVDLRDA